MSEHTSIEWCESTFNPWIGCTKVGPGCDHCYAEALMDKRWHKVQWGSGRERERTSVANWRQPLLWERNHEAFALANDGRRRRVFCASLADVFDNEAPAAWRAELFALIGLTPHLDWLLLTKRVGNVPKMLEQPGMPKDGLPANAWLGATVVNQEEADRDIPKLLATPARVRFLSIEPMLGPIDLVRVHGVPHSAPFNALHCTPNGYVRCVTHARGYCMGDCVGRLPALDWVIAGAESGPHARPAHPDWFRSLRDQCAAAGVPFLFKQWGEWLPSEAEDQPVYRGEHRHIGGHAHAYRVGKKAAGRLLDGRTHDGFPGAPR